MLQKLFPIFCLYLPFQLALNPGGGIDLASARVFILLLFFIWLAEGLKNKKIIFLSNIQTGLIIAFIFLSCFSWVAAKNPDWSLRKALFFLSIFPLYFVASNILSSRKRIFKTAKFLVIGATAISLVGIIQFVLQFIIGLEKTYQIWAEFAAVPFLGENLAKAVLQNPSWLVNISGKTYLRAIAFFPDPHMFSFYLGMMLPLALGLAVSFRKRKFFFFGSFCLILLADILTFSRGGYLGIFAGAVALLFFLWRKMPGGYKKALLLSFCAMVLLLLAPSPISQRFSSSFDLKEGSNLGRLEMWRKAYEVTRDNPLIGVGLGNYPLEVKADANYRDPIYAHNTYLDISSETGIINLLLWAGILFFSLRDFLAKAKQEPFFLFGAVSVVIFSAHSLVETGIYSPVVLPLFLIILSFANINKKSEIQAK